MIIFYIFVSDTYTTVHIPPYLSDSMLPQLGILIFWLSQACNFLGFKNGVSRKSIKE
jgi:hypothetical protein